MFGQVWEAPLSLAEPENELPYKGSKANAKTFYQLRYSNPPVIPSYPKHWKPDVVILEGMNMIYSAPNKIEHNTFEEYTHHLLHLYTRRHLLENRVKEVHIIFDNPESTLVIPKLMERSR